jgi:hypothetical protein
VAEGRGSAAGASLPAAAGSGWRPRRARAFGEDEVAVHLHPTGGLDGLGRGPQEAVATPGRHAKRYLAGALAVRTRWGNWVEGVRTTRYRCLDLVDRLVRADPQAERRPLILDDDRIPGGASVLAARGGSRGGKVAWHCLPPSCPGHSPIERVGQDVHANATRNHRCAGMTELLEAVRY